jgi:hypothetical protein
VTQPKEACRRRLGFHRAIVAKRDLQKLTSAVLSYVESEVLALMIPLPWETGAVRLRMRGLKRPPPSVPDMPQSAKPLYLLGGSAATLLPRLQESSASWRESNRRRGVVCVLCAQIPEGAQQ